MNKSRLKIVKIIIAAGFIGLLVLSYAFDVQNNLTIAAVKEKQAALVAYQSAHPLMLVGGFFLLYVAAAALSLPGATILTLLAGALLGFWQGMIAVSFASTIGATLAFLLARFLLRDWVQSKYAHQLAALNAGFTREGIFYLFALRLIPLMPFFLVNILAGLMPISVARFYAASQLGMLPGTAVFVYAGTEFGQLRSAGDILSPRMIAAFILLGLFPLLAKKTLTYIRRRRTV